MALDSQSDRSLEMTISQQHIEAVVVLFALEQQPGAGAALQIDVGDTANDLGLVKQQAVGRMNKHRRGSFRALERKHQLYSWRLESQEVAVSLI